MREWDLAKLTWQEAQQAVADAGAVLVPIGMKVYMHLATREAADRRETLEGLGTATSRYVRYDAHHRGPQVNVPMHHIAEFSRSGVVGDATLARKDLGEELLRVVVDRMGEFLLDISRPPKAPSP